MISVVKARLSVSAVPLNTSASMPLSCWTATVWPSRCRPRPASSARSSSRSMFWSASIGWRRTASFSFRSGRLSGALWIQPEAGTDMVSARSPIVPNTARINISAASASAAAAGGA